MVGIFDNLLRELVKDNPVEHISITNVKFGPDGQPSSVCLQFAYQDLNIPRRLKVLKYVEMSVNEFYFRFQRDPSVIRNYEELLRLRSRLTGRSVPYPKQLPPY